MLEVIMRDYLARVEENSQKLRATNERIAKRNLRGVETGEWGDLDPDEETVESDTQGTAK